MLFILIFWMPYYFTLVEYDSASTYILIVMPFSMAIGSLILNYVVNHFFSHLNSTVTTISMILQFIAFTCLIFLGTDPERVALYFVLLALGNAFIAFPYSKACST
jgi:predicted MFS family arabinose efflux permease